MPRQNVWPWAASTGASKNFAQQIIAPADRDTNDDTSVSSH